MRFIILIVGILCLSSLNLYCFTLFPADKERPDYILGLNFGLLINDDSGYERLFKSNGYGYKRYGVLYNLGIGFHSNIEYNSNHYFGLEISLFIGNGYAQRDSFILEYPTNIFNFFILSYYYKIKVFDKLEIAPVIKGGLSLGGLFIRNNSAKDSISFEEIHNKNIINSEELVLNSGFGFIGLSIFFKGDACIDIGYLFMSSSWDFSGYKLSDMPDYLIKGLFLNLNLRAPL
ncbi:MAG: hypothetical protein EPN82_08000 [Bacteroidetes bacterium]|nr:MAG: hypothetical protein EPN82_08000 [Bacteroidota bacterium]